MFHLCCFFVSCRKRTIYVNATFLQASLKEKTSCGFLAPYDDHVKKVHDSSGIDGKTCQIGSFLINLKNRLDADGPWIAWMGLKMSKTCATPLSGPVVV